LLRINHFIHAGGRNLSGLKKYMQNQFLELFVNVIHQFQIKKIESFFPAIQSALYHRDDAPVSV